MGYVVRIIGVDVKDVILFISGLLTIILGYIGIVAVGNLLAHVIIGQPQVGIDQFAVIMNLDAISFHEYVRAPLGVLNWAVLFTITIWMIVTGTRRYAASIQDRTHVARLQEIARQRKPLIAKPSIDEGYKRAGNGE